METQTRYNLNAAIENWRSELAAQPNLTAEVRRELETHLRDAIAGFQQRGLSDEESFWLACKRVGQPPQLGEEFAKADPVKIWRERAFWMVLASVILTLAASSVDLLGRFVEGLLFKNDLSYHLSIERMSLFTSCFRLFFYWLPISACALSLASGRLLFNSQRVFDFFHSRLRLLMTALLWILINIAVNAWQSWPLFQELKHSLAKNTATAAFNAIPQYTFWVSFRDSLFPMGVWPLLLVVLLLWLMPTQNQRTPKHT